MPGSKIVVLVPDVATRETVRAIAGEQAAKHGVHASISLAQADLEGCVRDTRRALGEGPLAALTRDEDGALRALAAGADEAFSLPHMSLDQASWGRLLERTKLKNELRRAQSERLASLSQLEKLCSLGRLVSGVAEELSGPLHGAQVALEALKLELDPIYAGIARLREAGERGEGLTADELHALLRAMGSRPAAQAPSRASEVISDITETCSAISHVTQDLGLRELGLCDRHEAYEFVDLRQMLDNLLRLFRRAAVQGTYIERDYGDELPELLAPRARVAQVLISLIANALANLRAEPRTAHRLRIRVRAADGSVTITVSDNARGVRAPALERVFTTGPGERTSAPEELDGSGLQLSVTRSQLRSLGGDLLLESTRGEGSTLIAWLPCPKHHEQRVSGTVPKPDPRSERRRTVLVLEPNRMVLAALSHLLREQYDVLLAQSGPEAREVLSGGVRPDAIVAAIDDAEARRFIEWVLLEHVDLTRRLLLTSDLGELDDELLGLPFLEKPLEPSALLRAIEARFVAPLRKSRVKVESGRQPRVAKG